MSVVQIPNLTAATSLNGTEQLEAVQSGASVKLTTAQIGSYVATTYPAPGISSVVANSPLTSATVSGAVTITLPTQSITNSYLATMAAGTVKANLTGGSATPTDVTPSAILNTFGTQTGSLLYRDTSSWQALTSGTNATILRSNGTTSAPSWSTLSTLIDAAVGSSSQGSLLFRGATSWQNLSPGTAGQFLQTQGSGANPAWFTVSSTGTVTSIATGTGLTGGPITTTGTISIANTTVTANSYGSASSVGSFTVNAQGQLTAASSTPIAIAASQITSGTLPVAQGGTGIASYTIGDLIYASGTTTLSTLADVATGNALLSGGVGGAPSWGKVNLTSAISGTLPIGNGGTGQTTASAAFNALSPVTTTGDLIIGNGTNSATRLAIGANGYVLTSNGTTATWAASGGGGGVTTLSFGSTGLTPSTATSGAVTVAGTLAVANGGTGVTASTGANSVALRDANANLTVNSLFEGFTNVAAAGTTTTLTAASNPTYVVTGSGGQTFQLPDATTLPAGAQFSFNNNQSSGTVIVKNNSGTTLVTLQSGAFVDVTLLVNSPAAGSWDTHNQAPSNASWSTNTLSWAGSYTSGTWNGNAIGAIYGGTGVANNAASTLTISGAFGTTLTVTGTTSVTLPTSGTLVNSAVTTLSSLVSIGTITTGVWNGTAIGAIYGGTAQTSYTTGDILYASASNTLSKLAATTNGYVLTLASGIPTWAAASSGTGTVNSGTTNQLTYYASTGTAVSGNANATISSGALTLGVAGTAAGSLLLSGSTSGAVTVKSAAAAGTWSLTLPTTGGTSGYVLQTDGTGVTSWIAQSGGGGGTSTGGNIFLADYFGGF